MDDTVFPFPIDDGVSRHLAATAKQKGSVNLGAGQSPIDPVDGQTHTHGYNTSLKRKVQNPWLELNGDMLCWPLSRRGEC